MKIKTIKILVLVIMSIINTSLAYAESVTVNLTREGTLAEKVLEKAASLATVTELTVSGNINSDDWNCLTVQMTGLTLLNLKDSYANFESISSINSHVTHLDMPKGIKIINSMRSYSLKEITFNDELERISSGAFMTDGWDGCPLKELIFPPNIKFIGDEAFRFCHSLSKVDMSYIDGTNLVLEGAIFEQCENLKTVILPEGLKSISGSGEYDGLFYSCSSLETVELPNSLERIGGGTFRYCYSLNTITIPENVEYIGPSAFYECTKLKSVNIKSTKLKTISTYAFYKCTLLESVSLPSSLLSINTASFAYCSSLKEISFPESIISIGSSAFNGCSGLTKVTCLIPFPISTSSGIFTGINQDNCTLIVPEWSALLYKMAIGWSEFSKIETVKTGDLALLSVNDKRSLPESVRPNGTPNVFISDGGSLTVRGNNAFNMNELTLNLKIDEGKRNYYYDDNWNYVEYYTPSQYGSCLLNDESSLTARSAKLGIKSRGAAWGFITLPFDANLSDIIPMVEGDENNYIWKTYDGERRALLGSGGNWKTVSGTLKAGTGYIYQSQNQDSIYVKALTSTLTNMLGNSDISIPLTTYSSNDTEDENWNFIGNPYPTYFNTKYIDFTAPITVWNGMGYDAISLTDDNYTLAPCQAFFVQKQKDTESIKFFAEGRTTEYSQNNNNSGYYYAKSRSANNNARTIVNLYLSGNDYSDRSRVVFNDNASVDYELSCDATKFMSDNSEVPQLFSLDIKGRQYAINERPTADGNVALGIIIPETGEYTISVGKDCLSEKIYLIDNKENVITDLSSSDYTFQSDAISTNNRFVLSLSGETSGVATMNIDMARIAIVGNTITINGAVGKKLEIYNIDGRCLRNEMVSHGTEIITLQSGSYVVKIGDKTNKIYIK